MGVYRRGKIWWYRFTFYGQEIRESTKQSNKRVAEQMEAAHKTALAKNEVGIRERKPAPTLSVFAERDFLPFIDSTFAEKPKTRAYYRNGVQNLLAYDKLAGEPIDVITTEKIAGFVASRQKAKLATASINRELQVLRRMFRLAQEWGKVDKVLPAVKMLPGERHRERVLTPEEEAAYLKVASPLASHVATILLDCGLRPEECFRLRWENVADGCIEIQHGKTAAARRRIPLSKRAAAILEMRKTAAEGSPWVFPAPTKSGHMEPFTLRKQHARACENAKVEPFELYVLRHTCLTRWAPHMDPWTLAYLAGHRDMAITKRYVHPQADNIREAIERARGRHKSRHSSDRKKKDAPSEASVIH